MELFIDESGNTGCVITKNNKFNFDEQRHFVLCAIKVISEEDKNMLIQKYKDFKRIFKIKDEIKGSDLMTRKYNSELEYFIENILDDKHFEICVYDKKFYLSTLLLLFLLGNEFQTDFPAQFYSIAADISFNCDELLKQYCELVKSPTAKMFEAFLKNVITSPYREVPNNSNPLIMVAERILEVKKFELWLNDILSYGSYENPNYVNVINLNCLSELILSLKWQTNISNKSLKIYHDNIDGYDKTFISELQNLDFELDFADSKSAELIQVADNAVGIFSKCINDVMKRFEQKKEWEVESQWIMAYYSKVLNIVDITNIKFTIPIPNWAASLCVKDMFSEKYPAEQRKNLYFNQIYTYYTNKIINDIDSKDFSMAYSTELLNR